MLGIVVVAVLAIGGGAGLAAHWLSNQDQPEKADAILILAGDPSRAFHAADLYASGYADKIYISRPVRLASLRLLDESGVPFPRYEDIDRQVLIRKGVPENAILVLERPSGSTAEEAINTAKLLAGRRARLLLVTSPYHVRRARMVFRDLLPNAELMVVATPYETFPAKWWQSQDAARSVLLEMTKIVFYLAGGKFYVERPAS
jgi:uncharacterized SAM-binding protein YcdF (DUF218 family)